MRGRLVPLVVLAALTALVAAAVHAAFRVSVGAGTTPVRVTGLSLVLAVTFLVVPPAMLAVAARRQAWFAHWAAGAIVGLGTWFALGAMSPSLALAGAVGGAIALPVRYPLHRVVRVATLTVPGTFTWLVAGTGAFAGFSLVSLTIVLAAPLFFVVFDLVTWDGPRLVMRQLGRQHLPGRMDRIEAGRFERQVEWQSWSVLGLLVGVVLVMLWWGGGRAPYRPAYVLVPAQVEVTDTWLDVNGEYNLDWARTQSARADASTYRVFAADDGRRLRLSVTNTGNPLLADMYFTSSYGATESIERVSLNALATPTVIRTDVVDAERIDCTARNDAGGCGELVYTASHDQYLVEIVMSRPAQLKVGQLSPIVDQTLEHLDRRLGR